MMDAPFVARASRLNLRRIALALGLGLGAIADLPSQGLAQNAGPTTPFQGRALLALSDADMKASAYIDGKLGSEAGPDMLSVIGLGVPPKEMRATAVPVSNSVAGPPQSLAVSPDGTFAIAVETWGPRPPNKPDATMKELAPGHEITVIDLTDLARPRVVERVRSFEHPLSVSIDRTGTLVAVAFGLPVRDGQPALALFRFKDGHLSAPIVPRIPNFAAQDVLISAQFHPKADELALVYSTHPRLALMRYDGATVVPELSLWGNEVGLDHQPFLVRFTPDGRFAVVNDMFYGADVADANGSLISVAIARSTQPDGTPVHKIVSHLQAENDPEGLAISPDGAWVVTTNLEHSPEPSGSEMQGFFSSITLYSLASESGRLAKVGVFPFDGVLPEAAEFDNSSRMLAVANFDCFDCSPGRGAIDFWRLSRDAANPGRVLLIRGNDSIPVARGPQSMAIVR